MKISVVMPSFNQSRFVEAAIRSVLDQDYADKELLFVDGGSTDGTMEIAGRFRDRMAHCASEPDNGQSEALHNGFTRATGDILTWLNTDDILLPGALSEVARAFSKRPDADCVFGNIIWIDRDGLILRCRKGERYHAILSRFGRLPVYGPTAFFTADLYRRCGGVSTELHYLMDTELWWRFVDHGAKFARLDDYTWAFRLHADAKTSAPMFTSAPSEKLRKAMLARAAERRLVDLLVRRRFLPGTSIIAPLLHSSVRLTSPNYLWSFYDSFIWKHKPIELFLSSRSKPS